MLLVVSGSRAAAAVRVQDRPAVFAPKGQNMTAQGKHGEAGRRPGLWRIQTNAPRWGRDIAYANGIRMSHAFRVDWVTNRFPRALPWAVMYRPYGASEQWHDRTATGQGRRARTPLTSLESEF